MICDVCGVEIPRGQRYKGERYTSSHFCSQECYDQYVLDKEQTKAKLKVMREVAVDDKTEYRKFTDVLNRIYPEEYQNWPLFGQQANNYINNYDLDFSKLRCIVVYAMNYANHPFNPEISLAQFFPRYIEPCMRFMERLRANATQELPDDTLLEVTKTGTHRNYKVKAVDFDD